MNNVMIDLESLGKRAGCVILSIGAVAFDPTKGLGLELYNVVRVQDQLELGLHVDPSTQAWWSDQSPQARQVLVDANSDQAMPFELALDSLDKFFAIHDPETCLVWGNGADFDNAILIAAYAALGREVPWSFWHNRCYRTLKNIVKGPRLQRIGTHHNALDDARSQAIHACELLSVQAENQRPRRSFFRWKG